MTRLLLLTVVMALMGCHGDGAVVKVPTPMLGEDKAVELGVQEYVGAMNSLIFTTVPAGFTEDGRPLYKVHVYNGTGLLQTLLMVGGELGSAAMLADALEEVGDETTITGGGAQVGDVHGGNAAAETNIDFDISPGG